MYSTADTPRGVGCPIRMSTDQRLLAAPRGFSQRATSFIASWCQGIHRMPFSRSRSGSPAPADRNPPAPHRQPTMHRSQPHPEMSLRLRRPAARQARTQHTHGIAPASHRPIPTPLNASARSRGSHVPPHGGRTCRSDTATKPRPATHQNLIHPDKDQFGIHTRHPRRRPRRGRANPLLHRETPSSLEATSSLWRRSDSNRRPPACKAGALPVELRPLSLRCPLRHRWWAREDLNLRPHAYQACALTN